MATIVELSSRQTSRYSRKFGEVDEAGAEVLLFTGVRYERSEDTDLDGAAHDLDEIEFDDVSDVEVDLDPLETVR